MIHLLTVDKFQRNTRDAFWREFSFWVAFPSSMASSPERPWGLITQSVLLNTLKVNMAFEVVYPPTSLAEDCQSLRPLKANDWYCPRKWDHFLCWPRVQGNKIVAIPCNASAAFVELVTLKSTQQRLIPGMHNKRHKMLGSTPHSTYCAGTS